MAQKHITLTKVGALSLAPGEMLTHLRVFPNCWISVQGKHTCSNVTSFKKKENGGYNSELCTFNCCGKQLSDTI